MQITVTPDVIDPNGHADVSHNGTSTITVTITNNKGGSETIEVPPNTTVQWSPPDGWTEARFNAPGCSEVFRYIESQASA